MIIQHICSKQAIAILMILFTGCSKNNSTDKIDRYEVVTRHNVHLDKIDTLNSLSVGNGEFAYTVDITGMQTFPEAYENGVSLGTQSQWGWHTIPNDQNYTLDDVAVIMKAATIYLFPMQFSIRQEEPLMRQIGFGPILTDYTWA